MTIALAILTVLASISPLLTLAHLWQLKEWRWDRLREHLRSEGYLRQLFGVTRPVLLTFSVLIAFLLFKFSILHSQFSILIPLLALTGLNTLQIGLKRQPAPIWTPKAGMFIATGLVLTGIASYLVRTSYFVLLTSLLPLLQPFFLAGSWLLLWPLDQYLKRRLLRKAKNLREQFPNLTVIGITGSVGKTTTKELLAHILRDLHPLVTPEHVNTEMGVAQWLLRVLKTQDHQLKTPLIIEMGAYRTGEISLLCSIARPTMGVITWIGSQHLGLFGSEQATAEAKGELFASLPADGHAFIPALCPYRDTVQKLCRCPVTVVEDEMSFPIPLEGVHQRGNVLLAIAAARHLGMNPESISQKLATFSPPSHTFDLRQERGITLLDDTHNSSPQSFSAAILWAKQRPEKERTLLAAGIIELGKAEREIHTNLGREAKEVFTRVIFLNKKFAQFFKEGFGKPVEIFSPSTQPVSHGSLLACIGRMPQSTIKKLLPV